MGQQAHQALGQFDQPGRGAIHAIALLGLAPGRGLDLGMLVAGDHRPPAAHEIEVFAAIGVPQPAALGAREELRIARRQAAGSQVAIHSAGNDPGGAAAQPGILKADAGARIYYR